MACDNSAVEAWESLFRAQVGVMRTLAEDFPLSDLSFNEYDALFTLSREPERTAHLRDLNRLMLLSQPSVSRLIDRLAARGFVAKCVDPNDKRSTIVTMTDAGFAAFRPAARAHMARIEDILNAQFSHEELTTLRELTDRLRERPVAEADDNQ